MTSLMDQWIHDIALAGRVSKSRTSRRWSIRVPKVCSIAQSHCAYG